MANSDSGIDSQSSPEMEKGTMSRTHQYRKVMKPLLERKRRARINKCLDELKDLMVYSLGVDGDSGSKLEKADILEVTVQYLRKLKQTDCLALTPNLTYSTRFRQGFNSCTAQVATFLQQPDSGVQPHAAKRILSRLQRCQRMNASLRPSALATRSFNAQPFSDTTCG